MRFRLSVLVGMVAFAALSVNYAIANLGINTDTADMISEALPWRQHFIDYRSSFPIRDRNLAILITASEADVERRFAEDFAASLRSEPGLFRSVFLAGDGEFFDRNGLLYLPVPVLENLSDRMIDAQPMIGLVKQQPNAVGVLAILSDIATVETTTADTDALLVEVSDALQGSLAGIADPVDWRQVIASELLPAQRNIILVQPVLDFSRVQPARPAIERIRALAESSRTGEFSGVSVRMTGTLAMEHEELESVMRGAGTAGILAVVMVIIVLQWALRSIVLVVVSIVALLVGLTGTAAFAAIAVGHLNLLSVAFAVLYVGLGVDFILHICLRVKELAAQGREVEVAITESMTGVGASLVICAVTTAAGFYSFIPTPFEGVSELGLISGSGMFVSLFASVTFLPALLAQFYSPNGRASAAPRLARLPGSSTTFSPRVTLAAAVVVLLICTLGLPRLAFDSNPVHLRDPQSESVQVLNELADSGDADLYSLIAIAEDAATAREWAATIKGLDAVGDVLTVESLVPDGQDQKQLIIEDLDLIMGPGFGEFERREAALGNLVDVLARLRRALLQRGELRSAQARLLVAVEMLQQQLAASTDAEDLVALVDDNLIGNLPNQLSALEASLSAQPFDRTGLPAQLRDRWIDANGREIVEIVPVENISDNEQASRFVDEVRAILPSATGPAVVYQEASNTVVLSFQLALAYAFAFVTILLLVFLRNLADAVLVLAPIIAAAVATAGATAWLGWPFNFANIIALPLLVGVGVDNGIHIVHRMRTEPPRDGEPLHTSTSRAVLASGLTTIASFGNLGFSAHVGMSSMGKLLTLGMAVTLLATLMLLPALLRLRVSR